MSKEEAIKLFQDKKVRVHRDQDKEKWYYSIVDVVAVLTENNHQSARNYWKVLKNRLLEEGNETVTNCNHLKPIMINRNTIEFLELWESINSPDFKGVEINPLLHQL